MEQVVGFVGYECEDIAIYLARILVALGKKIAIIDRTEQEMLLEVLGMKKREPHDIREGDFSGIWITNQGGSYEEYDMVFLLFGYRLLHPKLYECEVLIMITDGVPAHASLLKQIGSWNRKQYLLIRNLVPMKHSERYLAMLADNEENYCEVLYDEHDTRMRYNLSSFSDCNIKRLSMGMKKALFVLIQFLIPECQEKQVKGMMKRL